MANLRGVYVLPLTLSEIGTEYVVRSVGGKPWIRQFLGELGIVEGSKVTVVSSMAGNLIVKVKDDARVALGREMAARILV